jgi:hypothetical protein
MKPLPHQLSLKVIHFESRLSVVFFVEVSYLPIKADKVQTILS